MTISRAKEILGTKVKDWSDERLQQHLDSLNSIAEIAAESAIECFFRVNMHDEAYKKSARNE